MKKFIIPLLVAFTCFLLLSIIFPVKKKIIEKNVAFSKDTGNETHYETISYDTTYVDLKSGDTITETVVKMAPHRPSKIEFDKKNLFNIKIEYPETVRKNKVSNFKLTISRDSFCTSQNCEINAFLKDPYTLLQVDNSGFVAKEVKNKNTWLWSFLPNNTSRLKLFLSNNEGGFRYEKEVLIKVTLGFWGSIFLFIRENALVSSTLFGIITYLFKSIIGLRKKTENNG